MFGSESQIVLVSPTDPAGSVNLACRAVAFSAFQFQSAFSFKINVSRIKQTGVNESVERFLTKRQDVFEEDVGMMNGLSLTDQWRNECVYKIDLFLSQIEAFAYFGQSGSVFFVGVIGRINESIQRTGSEGRTGIADVGRSGELVTDFFTEVGTVIVAQTAGRTLAGAVGLVGAN